MKKLIAPLLLLLLVTGCTNIKDKTITDGNMDEVVQQANKKLAAEERDLFQKAVARHMIGGLFGEKSASVKGMTVGQLIEEQRRFNAEAKAEEEKQARLAAEAAAKAAALRKLIVVSMFDAREISGFMSDALEVKFAYQNDSGKNIRAFQGRVQFKDVLGNKLEDWNLKVLTPVKAGERGTVTERYPFMVAPSLRNKKLEDLKLEWQPSKIVFEDGTFEGEASSGS